MLRLLLIILIVLNVLVFTVGRGWLAPETKEGEPERLENQISPDALKIGEPPERPATPPIAAVTPPPEVPASQPEEIPPVPLPQESADVIEPDEPVEEPAPESPPQEVLTETVTPAPATGTEPAELSPPAAQPQPQPQRICLAYAGVNGQTADLLEQTAKNADPDVRITRALDGPPITWWVHIPPAASGPAAEARAKQLREQGVTDLFIVRDAGPNQFAISLGIFRTQASAKQHQLNLQRQKIDGTIISPRNPVTYKLEIRGIAERLTPLTASRQNLPASSGRCTP